MVLQRQDGTTVRYLTGMEEGGVLSLNETDRKSSMQVMDDL